MLGIYFNETPEETEVALDVRRKLRSVDINCGLRNAALFNDTQLETFEAVLAIDCPHVAEIYEDRNNKIRLAKERGDLHMFAGIPEAEIFQSIDSLMEAISSDDDIVTKELEEKSLESKTKEELVALAAEREIVLDMKMSKTEMLEKLK